MWPAGPNRRAASLTYTHKRVSALPAGLPAPPVTGLVVPENARFGPFPLFSAYAYLIRRDYPRKVPMRRGAYCAASCRNGVSGHVCISNQNTSIAPDTRDGRAVHVRPASGRVSACCLADQGTYHDEQEGRGPAQQAQGKSSGVPGSLILKSLLLRSSRGKRDRHRH